MDVVVTAFVRVAVVIAVGARVNVVVVVVVVGRMMGGVNGGGGRVLVLV